MSAPPSDSKDTQAHIFVEDPRSLEDGKWERAICLGHGADLVGGSTSWRQGGQDSDLVVAGLPKRVAQPFETLVETISARSAGGLDVL